MCGFFDHGNDRPSEILTRDDNSRLVQGPQAPSRLPAFQSIIQSARLSWTHRKSRWPRLVMSKGINRRSCPLWECRKRARYLASSRQIAIVFSSLLGSCRCEMYLYGKRRCERAYGVHDAETGCASLVEE